MMLEVVSPTPTPPATMTPLRVSAQAETFLGWTSTAWTGVTTLLTAGLLLAAIAAAVYAARQWSTARDQANNARAAEAEASRPYVIVSVQPSRASRKLFNLVVENIGVRPAFDVEISIDPPPVRAREEPGNRLSEAKFLNEPMAMLAPGRAFEVFYDSHPERRDRDDLPSSHDVVVKYQNSTGTAYEETSQLDLNATKGSSYVEVKTVHHVHAELKKIADLVTKASLFQRQGWVHAEVDVEPRTTLEERENQKRQEMADEAAAWRAAQHLARSAEATQD